MMNRLEAFKEACQRLPYQKMVRRLSEAEFDIIVDFIEDNDSLPHLEFEYAVNRMFLFQQKPKNFTIVMEMLTVANTSAKGIARKNRLPAGA